MAMYNGMLCLKCEQQAARRGSHFCSPACEAAFMAAADGPVECRGGNCVSHGLDTVAEAVAAGWEDIEPDPDGMWWNYSGLCPECQADLAVIIR